MADKDSSDLNKVHETIQPPSNAATVAAIPQSLPTKDEEATPDHASKVTHTSPQGPSSTIAADKKIVKLASPGTILGGLGDLFGGDDSVTPMVVNQYKFPPPLDWDNLIRSQSISPPDDAVNHRWYVGLENTQTSYGIAAKLSRYRPKVEHSGFSLIQTSISNSAPGHPMQTIESGWQRWGNRDIPHFFIYYTTTGYDQPFPATTFDNGLGFGGYANYNASDPADLGDWYRLKTLPPLTACHIDGDPLTVDVRWQLLKDLGPILPDGWYLQVNGDWIGCYKLELFTKKPPNTVQGPNAGKEWPLPDRATTLADHADDLQVYGEIYDPDFDRTSTDPTKLVPTSTDMGSGKYPGEGWKKAAFISNIERMPNEAHVSTAWEDAGDNWTEKNKYVDTVLYEIRYQPKSPTILRSFCFLGGRGGALDPGTWSEWENVSNNNELGFFAQSPASKITLLEHTPVGLDPDRLNVFAIASDEKVHTCFWSDEDWSGFNTFDEWRALDWGDSRTPKFAAGTKITAVARSKDNIDLFAIAKDGKLYNAWWTSDEDWNGWRPISGNLVFAAGTLAPVSVVSRSADKLDIFVNDGGTIFWASWAPDATEDDGSPDDTPPPWSPIDTGQPAQEMLALSTGTDSMQIFLTDIHGHVRANAFQDPDRWSASDIGTMAAPPDTDPPSPSTFDPGAKVAGVSKGSDSIDLFVVGPDNNLWTIHWDGSAWGGDTPDTFFSLGAGSSVDASGAKIMAFESGTSDVVAITRKGTFNTGSIDVFVTGVEGLVWRTSWNEATELWSSLIGSWDSGIGGVTNTDYRNVPGFSVAAASKAGFALTVLMVDGNGVVTASDYQGP